MFIHGQENRSERKLRKRRVKLINHDFGPALRWVRVDHDVLELVLAVREGLGQHRLGDAERACDVVQLIGRWRPWSMGTSRRRRTPSAVAR